MKKTLLTLILSSLLSTSVTANELLFEKNIQNDELNSTSMIEINEDDFYLEPKEIIKGKEDIKGFAQLNTKNIPVAFEDQNYIELLSNELERLNDLPDQEDLIKTGKALPILKSGNKGENVKLLISGLVANGFMQEEESDGVEVYNDIVVNAVKEAQDYYGISIDGIAGPEVYRNLFISKNDRIEQIKTWLAEIDNMIEIARNENKPYVIIVNVPSYTLHVIETNNKMEVLQSKVIVGKSSSKTPIYRANISGIKYYPTWNPPMSVVKRNVLPNMTLSNSMRVVNSKGQTIPISQVSKNEILTGKYSVQQTAGVHNSLGILKFETDSTDAIYLHDTNNRSLFNKKNRALSLGCVRVEQWTKLASLIANSDENYILGNINKKRTYIERMDKMPLFYTYSLVDAVEGKVGHYNDIYNRIK